MKTNINTNEIIKYDENYFLIDKDSRTITLLIKQKEGEFNAPDGGYLNSMNISLSVNEKGAHTFTGSTSIYIVRDMVNLHIKYI